MALYTSIGVNTNCIGQILSMDVYNSEDEMYWRNFFKLQERGLTGIQLVISDGHRGIMNAVKESFPGIIMAVLPFHKEFKKYHE